MVFSLINYNIGLKFYRIKTETKYHLRFDFVIIYCHVGSLAVGFLHSALFALAPLCMKLADQHQEVGVG